MAPTLVREPFHRDGRVYEEKVDGWRMLAYKEGQAVRLVSRWGKDHTRRFPGIVASLRKLDTPSLVLDGELAIYDAKLISRFEWLRHHAPQELATPPLFMAFDCLHVLGKDLLTLRPCRLRDLRACLGQAVSARRSKPARGWRRTPDVLHLSEGTVENAQDDEHN
jgi:ATP-dependent DNA ligase